MVGQKSERLNALREQIAAACNQAGRDAKSVTLIAVSKTKPWEDIASFAELGQSDFGENYVQEAIEKQKHAKEAGLNLRWHLIGTLQSNKAKFVPGNFTLFHALDSLRLAQKLNQAADAGGFVQDCLLEVNVDREISKGGVHEGELAPLLEKLSALPNVRIKGLMCIPDPQNSAKDPRAPFASLRTLLEQLNQSSAYREKLTELSMGMSSDFEAAILEGATFIRVGTTLFGERKKQ